MNVIPVLTEKDIERFKGKRVLLYMCKGNPTPLYEVFSYLGIEVIGYCIKTEPSNIKKIEDALKGLICITEKKLQKLANQSSDIIVQLMGADPDELEMLKNEVIEKGLEHSPLRSGEILSTFSYLVEFEKMKNPFQRTYLKVRRKMANKRKATHLWSIFKKGYVASKLAICLPAKTADHSIGYTFDKVNRLQSSHERIDYLNFWHNPRAINRVDANKKLTSLKILTSVREPISQNISVMYQTLSTGLVIKELILTDLENQAVRKKNEINIIVKHEKLFCALGLDTQMIWDIYEKIYIDVIRKPARILPNIAFIQYFFSEFTENVLDITVYPFDKERGYSIIKEGNIEVFVYQLEKLNDIVPELSEWVGVPFNEIEKANAAEDKWIAESYKQAQKEIEITQEYFDKCFDEPYVKHCYSDADIEKFKARWRPHIKKSSGNLSSRSEMLE